MEKKVEKEYCWYPNDNFIAYLVEYSEANEFQIFYGKALPCLD